MALWNDLKVLEPKWKVRNHEFSFSGPDLDSGRKTPFLDEWPQTELIRRNRLDKILKRGLWRQNKLKVAVLATFATFYFRFLDDPTSAHFQVESRKCGNPSSQALETENTFFMAMISVCNRS